MTTSPPPVCIACGFPVTSDILRILHRPTTENEHLSNEARTKEVWHKSCHDRVYPDGRVGHPVALPTPTPVEFAQISVRVHGPAGAGKTPVADLIRRTLDTYCGPDIRPAVCEVHEIPPETCVRCTMPVPSDTWVRVTAGPMAHGLYHESCARALGVFITPDVQSTRHAVISDILGVCPKCTLDVHADRPHVSTDNTPPHVYHFTCYPAHVNSVDVSRVNTAQPPPTEGTGPAIWDLVIADMKERDQIGERKYKRRLHAGDGRNTLIDAYQEALDLAVYLRKAIEETYTAATATAPAADAPTMEHNPATIQRHVCKALGVTVDQVRSADKSGRVTRARQIAIAFIHSMCNPSTQRMASGFNRCNATVQHSIHVVARAFLTPGAGTTFERRRMLRTDALTAGKRLGFTAEETAIVLTCQPPAAAVTRPEGAGKDH